MQLLTLGLNHTTAPLAVRERVAFLADEVGATIARLRERLSAPAGGNVSEAAIVSTCNRTELYCAVEEPEVAQQALHQFVASRAPAGSGRIAETFVRAAACQCGTARVPRGERA